MYLFALACSHPLCISRAAALFGVCHEKLRRPLGLQREVEQNRFLVVTLTALASSCLFQAWDFLKNEQLHFVKFTSAIRLMGTLTKFRGTGNIHLVHRALNKHAKMDTVPSETSFSSK